MRYLDELTVNTLYAISNVKGKYVSFPASCWSQLLIRHHSRPTIYEKFVAVCIEYNVRICSVPFNLSIQTWIYRVESSTRMKTLSQSDSTLRLRQLLVSRYPVFERTDSLTPPSTIPRTPEGR